nr:MAG TPA: PKHD-type hydroxylase C-terminal domain [Caudoviricetes sp.]
MHNYGNLLQMWKEIHNRIYLRTVRDSSEVNV